MSGRALARWSVCTLCLVGGALPRAAAETANRIVAVVNDDVITEADLTQFEEPSGQPHQDMRALILQRLIEHRLMLQEAKRVGLTVDPEDINDQITALRQQFHAEEEFQQSLADSGVSKEQLKQRIRDQLMVRKVVDAAVRSKIVVSPQEVARQLAKGPDPQPGQAQVNVLHILVRVGDLRDEASALARINAVSEQLKQGADFTQMAKQYSEDLTADAQGSIGWITQGQLMPELDSVIFHLKPGEMSEPIRTRLGFHLVKIGASRTASPQGSEDPQWKIQRQLYEEKFQVQLAQWLDGLKQHAYIELREER